MPHYPFHPLVIGSTQRRMPMIKNGKFDGDKVSNTTIDPLSNVFDLLAEIERPFGVCSWGIENGCNVISQYNRREEANVDVATDLEYILVLPADYE
jgi:hypothetical protein